MDGKPGEERYVANYCACREDIWVYIARGHLSGILVRTCWLEEGWLRVKDILLLVAGVPLGVVANYLYQYAKGRSHSVWSVVEVLRSSSRHVVS